MVRTWKEQNADDTSGESLAVVTRSPPVEVAIGDLIHREVHDAAVVRAAELGA